MTPLPAEKPNGFTAIELLAVIVIAALLAASFFAYFRQRDNDLQAQTDILKTHIRYTQSRAINTDTRWGLRFETDSRMYWLYRDPDVSTRIALPGQTNEEVNLGEMELDITGSSFNLLFDTWGRPVLTVRTFTDGQLALNLNRNGTDGDAIIITENTGFVP